jgi:TetR/AcrR family transcriptional regulator, fatty acid biosynthesis regulator
MKEVRRNAARHADATRAAAEYFLEFVKQNPDAFVVGLREIHSASTRIRRVLQDVLAQIAEESVDQILSMDLAPGLTRETLRLATTAITYYMFYRALDFIEQPGERAAIRQQIVTFARMQFFGAGVLQKAR